MKSQKNISRDRSTFLRVVLQSTRIILAPVVCIGFLVAPGMAFADNLLVNPGFEANSGHALPSGWTRFAPPTAQPNGNYWIESNIPGHTGSLFWKQWGASYLDAPTNNVAGLHQDFGCAPGSVFQANGWFRTSGNDQMGADCFAWVEVLFFGASSNLLALYQSDRFTAASGADVWIQLPVVNACDISAPVSLNDPYFSTYAVTGTVSQIVAPAGTTAVRYRFAYLQAGKQGGSVYFDDAVLDQVSGPLPPVITDLFPLNMIFVDPADGVSFNVTSPSGFAVNPEDVKLTLNNVDVSGNLVIGGTPSARTVSYQGLQSNTVYTASIRVTDSEGFTTTAETRFETMWVGIDPIVYLWEAEDFDFNSGQYINNPELCSVPGNPNCYFGKVGVEGIDEHSTSGGGSHAYRPDDLIGTGVSGDLLRKDLYLANRLDYRIDPFNFSEWVNYTRDWPNSTNWVVARVATDIGLSGELTLSVVNPDTSTTDLGKFSLQSGQGWTAYQNVYLRDTNGNIATVVLNGKATLRITSGGNLLPNFFALVAAQVDLPQIRDLYPTGNRPFESTNALSFTVSTVGATFPPDGIRLILNGMDVSSGLVFSGPDSTRHVVYPNLQQNAIHTAIINITNSLGNGISITNHFDTFRQDNFMVEMEDFDYDGGQFVSDWFPESYLGFGAVTNVDYHHTAIEGEPVDDAYRLAGIKVSPVHNYNVEGRDRFVSVGGFDYELDWFGGGDWANYTRNYPTGEFRVYLRASGQVATPYTVQLDRVVSGTGTENQVTQPLGEWHNLGLGRENYQWNLLHDPDTGQPSIVSLNGLATLRVTTPTGLVYPNYVMLVPFSGIRLSVERTENNIVISFPTRSGVTYRVLRTSDLGQEWTQFTTVSGDGLVQTVTDVLAPGQKFYQVVAP